MPKLFKYFLDFAALALLYFLWLCPKWRRCGKRVLAVNTVLFLYLSGVLLVTLMPVIASLPFCFSHRYVPMHMEPFGDAISGRGDFVRQIVLNVIMTVPFGFLYPLCRRAAGKKCGLLRCVLMTAALSLSVELLQPLINAARSADITDVITNTAGGLIGYAVYAIIPKKTAALTIGSGLCPFCRRLISPPKNCGARPEIQFAPPG